MLNTYDNVKSFALRIVAKTGVECTFDDFLRCLTLNCPPGYEATLVECLQDKGAVCHREGATIYIQC